MRRCCANSISNSFLSLNFVGSMWGSMDAYNTSYSLLLGQGACLSGPKRVSVNDCFEAIFELL